MTYEAITPEFVKTWTEISDSTYDKTQIESESEEDALFALTQLDARGYIARANGQVAAYTILTSIDKEAEHYRAGTLPEFFRKACERANWPAVIGKVQEIYGNDVQLWHLYDYAVVEEHRGNGVGKAILQKTLDDLLNENDVKVGFIQDDNTPSIYTTLKTGNILIGWVRQSYDGDHPAYISVYSKKQPVITPETVALEQTSVEEILKLAVEEDKIVAAATKSC